MTITEISILAIAFFKVKQFRYLLLRLISPTAQQLKVLQRLHLCLGKALQSCIRHVLIFGILKIHCAFHIIHK